MNIRREMAPFLGAPTVCAFALLAILGGCAETQLAAHVFKSATSDPLEPTTSVPTAAPSGDYKVGKPYQINGETYVPQVDPSYDVVGMASWYGADFHGKATANGDIYDMNALTAAHKTLPMPSSVRVTNLENGRSMVLTVNDRGPFAKDRVIDVSARAAHLLGFQVAGTAKVRVQALSGPDQAQEDPMRDAAVYFRPTAIESDVAVDVSVSTMDAPPGVKIAKTGGIETVALPPPASAATSPTIIQPAAAQATAQAEQGWYVQGGAFRDPQNAASLKRRLDDFGPAGIKAVTIDGATYYRVRVGPVYDQSRAYALLTQVVEAGHGGARLVIE
jgi:rare lipoprotein A